MILKVFMQVLIQPLCKDFGKKEAASLAWDSDAVLDCAFKELKLDGIFSDFADNVVEYLKKNGLR